MTAATMPRAARPAEPDAGRVEIAGRRLAIAWPDGRRSAFPLIWLRDNCLCPLCRHPGNGQRLLDTLDLPELPTLAAAALAPDGALLLRWAADGHESRYPAAWLAAHDLAPAARAARRPQPRLWGAEIADALPEASWPAMLADPAAERAALALFRERGFLILRRVPTEPGMVATVGDRLGHVRVTNYGRLFDVMSVPNPNNLAYTAVALGVHTDNPYRDPTPGIQLLHCLVAEAPGGENILVDGFRAAEALRREDADGFALLARLPLPFRFVDGEADLQAASPVITVDFEGRVTGIHFNNRSMAPLDLPLEAIEPWYVAYRRFAALLRRPEGELRLRLAPGDLLMMENNRVLHGRAAFETSLGRRHLQGCYIDRDGVESRLRLLSRAAEARL